MVGVPAYIAMRSECVFGLQRYKQDNVFSTKHCLLFSSACYLRNQFN